MQELVKNLEQYIADTEKHMEEAVAEMLSKKPPVLTEEKFALYEATGNRIIYEHDYFGKRRFLTLFGVAAMRMKQDELDMLGTVSKEEICCKLDELLLDVCREECWALPAHVNRKDNPDWRNTIDLFASETAGTLAEIIDAVGEWLSEECCDAVREQIKKRILDPFFLKPVNTNHWEQCDHNWNAVCNGAIASAYLHSLKEGEEGNPEYVERICENLAYFIDGYAEDGTCMEGLGYFTYGMTYFTDIAQELYDASEGFIDLFKGDWDKYKAGESDKRARIAAWWSQCFFKSGRTVSFSDGSSWGRFRVGLGCALAQRFEEVKLPDFKMAEHFEQDHCARFVPYKMDYFSTKRYLESLRAQSDQSMEDGQDMASDNSKSAGEFIILDSAQWCIGKAENGVGMACKGGHNDEPHNHNDAGCFLYVVGNDMLLTDLGAGEYTKEYFSKGRYNIFCNNSFSHSVPVIGGQGQKNGKEYKCTCFEADESEKCGFVKMGLERSYEDGLMKHFTRELVFDKENGNLSIVDTFDNQGKEILVTENLATQYMPEIQGDKVVLKGESGNCRIEAVLRTTGECFLSKSAEAAGEKQTKEKPVSSFRVVTKEHSSHNGKKEQVYLIQWDVPVQDRTEVHIIITNNV